MVLVGDGTRLIQGRQDYARPPALGGRYENHFGGCMRTMIFCTAVLLAASIGASPQQGSAKTLVAVFATRTTRAWSGPVLARYAREGAQVH